MQKPRRSSVQRAKKASGISPKKSRDAMVDKGRAAYGAVKRKKLTAQAKRAYRSVPK
jgi:hypothetical protein